jgi:carbohydrate diacid regulator
MNRTVAMIKAPEISVRLREHISALADEPSYLIDHWYASVMRVGDYARLGISEKGDIRNSISLLVMRWCSSILDEAWFSPEEIETFESSIRRRVHQGVSLVSILCANRLGIRELWLAHSGLAEQDSVLRDELLFVLSPYLLEYSEFMAQFIGRVFLEEQFKHSRWRREVRRKLYDLVFNGASDERDFYRIGRSLGFDSTLPHIALAIDCELNDPSKVNPEEALDSLAFAIARHVTETAEHVAYVTRCSRLVLWVPCVNGVSLIFNQRVLSSAVVDFASRSTEVRAIGIGLMNRGPKGWATSAEEAMTALDLGPYRGGAGKLHLYSDIVIDESIRANDSALRYFESMLGEILPDKDLTKTLECYFENNQYRKLTAASLGIHPNTLNYRLDRIETLLGARLDNPTWIARLFIALRLRKTVGVYPGDATVQL